VCAVGGGPAAESRAGGVRLSASKAARAKACAANGQRVAPGWVTTAHLMPSALPSRIES